MGTYTPLMNAIADEVVTDADYQTKSDWQRECAADDEPSPQPELISDKDWHMDCSEYLLGVEMADSLRLKELLIAAMDSPTNDLVSTSAKIGMFVIGNFLKSPVSIDQLRVKQ